MRSDSNILSDTDPNLIGLQTRPRPPAQRAMATTERIPAVANLNITVSNPPTQGEVQAVVNKVNELLGAMRRAGHLVP